MGDFVALGSRLVDLAAEQPERFEEERGDEMRLEPPRVGRSISSRIARTRVTSIVSPAGAAFDEIFEVVAVEGVFDDAGQSGADFGLVAVANGLEEQISQGAVFEREPPEDVEPGRPARRSSSSFSRSRW